MGAEVRHTKSCPFCGAKLSFAESDSYVHCYACDNDISVEELLSSNKSNVGAAAADLAVNSIESGESGLAYLDSIFETMDWDDFCLNDPSLTVYSIDRVVDKIKIKFANKGDTWLFEFKSVAIPVLHKFEKIEEIEKEIEEKYVGYDDTDLLPIFDSYKFIVAKLAAAKDTILKRLEVDLNFMNKFKAESKDIKESELTIKELKGKFEVLKEVPTLFDMDVVQSKIAKIEKEVIKELEDKGINAIETYNNAVKQFLNGDKKSALNLFESIRKYRDAQRYIDKLNDSFTMDNFLMFCNGTSYVFDKHTPTNEGDDNKGKKKSKKSVTANFIGAGNYGLFEIVDGTRRSKPVIDKIRRIMVTYAGKVYYVDQDNKFVYYDFGTKEIKEICDSKLCNFNEGQVHVYKDIGKVVFLGPNSEAPKKGCFKKGKQESSTFVSYGLDVLDLKTGELKTLEKDVVCFNQVFDEDIFFTKALNKEGTETAFMHVNADKQVVTKPFNREVLVDDVVDGKIIYTLWEPNINNLDLYSLDVETKKETLIERNIYNYKGNIEGMIYYTIGNYKYLPLYRANTDGSGIQEVVTNCEEIREVINGYMYITRGNGYNRVLIKMKADGTCRTYICSQFKTIIDIINGYIYYLDRNDNLHIVRSDGKDDRIIAEEVDYVFLINSRNIFFGRREYIGDAEGMGVSLYYMDSDGHNTHKLAFDILSAQRLDENTIVFSKDETIQYDVTEANEKGEYKNNFIVAYNVTTYYALNVNNLELTRVIMKNAPEFNTIVKKSGCFKKKEQVFPPKVLRMTYIYPTPSTTKMTPKGVKVEEEEPKAKNFVPKLGNSKGCGCSQPNSKKSSAKKSGCAGGGK